MYGIGVVKYKDFIVGYIEKGSLTWAARNLRLRKSMRNRYLVPRCWSSPSRTVA